MKVTSPSAPGRDILAPLLLLMAAAFCLYANTFGHPWIYDDFPVIVNNPDVLSLGAFFENTYPGRPLREVTFLLDYALFGMEPAGWHIQNIFWHGLNAFLVWLLSRRLAGSRAVAWIAALLFLVHPLQVEVVANISHRKDSLTLAFCLLSLLAYTEVFRSAGKRMQWLAASVALAFVAFMGKQNALVLPLIFVAYEMVFIDPANRLLARRKSFMGAACVLALGMGVAWFYFSGGVALHREAIQPLLIKMNHLSQANGSIYFAIVLKCWAFMFLKFVAPLNLAPEYTFPVPGSWLDPWVLSAIAGTAVYGFLLWRSFGRRPRMFFALALVGAFWLPTSNLWPLAYFAADRYLYAPSVGLCILAALLLHRFLGDRRVLMGTAVLVLVLPLAFLTWQQNRIWRSPLALWTQAEKVSPESTWALNNLGAAYMLEGEYAKALPLFQKAAKNFNDSKTLYNVGWAYEKMGDGRNAIRYYQMFVSMNEPKYQSDIRSLKKRLGWR